MRWPPLCLASGDGFTAWLRHGEKPEGERGLGLRCFLLSITGKEL